MHGRETKRKQCKSDIWCVLQYSYVCRHHHLHEHQGAWSAYLQRSNSCGKLKVKLNFGLHTSKIDAARALYRGLIFLVGWICMRCLSVRTMLHCKQLRQCWSWASIRTVYNYTNTVPQLLQSCASTVRLACLHESMRWKFACEAV